MRTLKRMSIGILLFLAGNLCAQVSVNVNIGSQPPWGPAGYKEVQYYYLPDVESYYDVPSGMFIYFESGVWIHRTYLPKRYQGYDLYSGYKVVLVDYHGKSPYKNHTIYKNKYKKGYKVGFQKTNNPRPGKGNSEKNHSEKNSDSKNHKEHENRPNKKQQAQPNQKQNKGNGGGKGKKH